MTPERSHPCPCGGRCVCHRAGTAFAPPCDVPGGCGNTTITQGGQEANAPESKPLDLGAVVRLWLEPTTRSVPVYVVKDGQLTTEVRERQVGAVLDELRAEIMPSQTAAGGGGGGLSAAATLEAIDARNLLYGTVLDWSAKLGLRGRRGTDEGFDPIRSCLRRLVAHGWTERTAERDQLARILDRQRRSVERLLAGDTNRYVPGTRCPRCKATQVREDDGTVHRPLRIDRERSDSPDGRPGPIKGTKCTACPAWWPYAQMDRGGQLDLELAADQAVYGTDVAAEGAQRAARRAEEAHRAATYGTTEGSAQRLGLPVYEPSEG